VGTTLLKKVSVAHFRALQNVDIEFSSHITLLCGKNGTAKSTILGIVAQIFSFAKDYTTGVLLDYRTIAGELFKSDFSDHFKLSPAYDVTGTMDVRIELFDGYTNEDATGDLTITSRKSGAGRIPRVVVRNNSTATDGTNDARNFTHPVIYLSLKRLYPIAYRNKYEQRTNDYLDRADVAFEFISLCGEILGKTNARYTSTTGTISSAVSHAENYDFRSVSAGQDNVGQIVMALLSFRKLKEEYGDNYKGGILLIDEADASLFPAAQTNLIAVLQKFCKDLSLQVVMTSHSVTMMDLVHELASKDNLKYGMVYLSDTHGTCTVSSNLSWEKILADINIRTLPRFGSNTHKVNVYMEDQEAQDLFHALVRGSNIVKHINVMKSVHLGCNQFISLIKEKVPEFSSNSVVCLDADVDRRKIRGMKTVILLPANLPPDQLLFEYLHNQSSNADIWQNSVQYTRPVFERGTNEIRRALGITGSKMIDLHTILKSRSVPNIRKIFKDWYTNSELSVWLKSRTRDNPWRHWVHANIDAKQAFGEKLETVVNAAFRARFGSRLF